MTKERFIERLALISEFASGGIRDLVRGHRMTSDNLNDALGGMREQLQALADIAKQQIEEDPDNVVLLRREGS